MGKGNFCSWSKKNLWHQMCVTINASLSTLCWKDWLILLVLVKLKLRIFKTTYLIRLNRFLCALLPKLISLRPMILALGVTATFQINKVIDLCPEPSWPSVKCHCGMGRIYRATYLPAAQVFKGVFVQVLLTKALTVRTVQVLKKSELYFGVLFSILSKDMGYSSIIIK